jgi:hypothetical protein
VTEVSAELSPTTLTLFLYVAGEAKHWDGTPPIEALIPFYLRIKVASRI